MELADNLSNFRTNATLKFPLNLTFDEYIFDNSAVRLGLYVVYTVVFGLCFFGNLAVVIVVTFHWRMRSVTKFCMGNLAFANLCVAVFCIYQNLSTFLQENWIFGRFLCKMYHFTNSLSHSASILILVVICGERYLSIVHPLRCRGMLTIQRLRLTIVCVWVLSGVISSPRLFYITTFEVPIPVGPDGHHDVICAPKRTLYDSRALDIIYFIVLFLLPLLAMSILYTRIGSIIWQSTAILQATRGSGFAGTTKSSPARKDGLDRSVAELRQTPPVPHNTLVSEEHLGSPKRFERIFIICAGKKTGENPMSDREICNPANGFYKCAEGSSRKWRVFPGKPERSGKDIQFAKAKLSLQRPAGVSRVKDERRGQLLQSRQAAIRMLIVIVLTFALCNLPYHLRKICQYYMANYNLWSSFSQFFTPVTFLLMYTNCALNPILYAFMSKNFRSSLRDLLQFRLSRPHPRVRRGRGRVSF